MDNCSADSASLLSKGFTGGSGQIGSLARPQALQRADHGLAGEVLEKAFAWDSLKYIYI